jgi:glycosyltransferase involved in cell wall biosynthesis
LITNYNYGRFVREAVDSALAQSYPRVEVIVVDDGSSDDSVDMLTSYGARILLVAQRNQGQGGAFNAGFAASHGEIICLLDADDFMQSNRVEEIVQSAKENPKAGTFVHPVRTVNESGAPIGAPNQDRFPSGDISDSMNRAGGYWPCPPTSGLAFRRDVFQKFIPIPTSDWRICADAYLVGLAPYLAPVSFVPLALSAYRLHGRNYWASRSGEATPSRSDLEARAQSFAARHENITRQAKVAGIQVRSQISDNYAYQFTLAELGSAKAFLGLFHIMVRQQPFVRRIEALRAPFAALWRLLKRRVHESFSKTASSTDSGETPR